MNDVVRRARLFLVLTRPAVVVLLALSASLGMSEAGHANDALPLAKVLVVVMAYLVFSVAVNDLSDREIDAVNLAGDTRRPLIVGTSTPSEFMVVAGSALAMALLGAALLSWRAPLVVLVGATLSTTYSLPPLRLAKRGALASVLLPIGYVAVPFFLGVFALTSSVTAAEVVLFAGLYIGFIGRIVLKDFRDVRGDALFGKRTFLVRHGRRPTVVLSAVVMAVGTALLAIVPGTTSGLRIADGFLLGVTLLLLRSLSADRGRRRDEALISAIAITGRGLLVTTFAHFSMTAAHWPVWRYRLVLTSLVVIMVGQAVTMARQGPPARWRLPATWGTERCPGGGDGTVSRPESVATTSIA